MNIEIQVAIVMDVNFDEVAGVQIKVDVEVDAELPRPISMKIREYNINKKSGCDGASECLVRYHNLKNLKC